MYHLGLNLCYSSLPVTISLEFLQILQKRFENKNLMMLRKTTEATLNSTIKLAMYPLGQIIVLSLSLVFIQPHTLSTYQQSCTYGLYTVY